MTPPTRTRPGSRVVAAVLGLGLATSALTALVPGTAHAAPVDITLLDINDYHGRIQSDGGTGSGDATTYSTVELATTVQGIRAERGAGNVLFLSAGDNIGASLFNSAHTEDEPTIEVLNALGLATTAVGNHEFDKGIDWLRTNVVAGTPTYTKADFPLLGANVYAKGTTTPVPGIQEYSTHSVAGVDVCVIGAVTQETASLVSPAGIASLDFGDPVVAVNRVAGQLETAGTCDVTVASYHEGAGAGTPDGSTLEQEIAAGGAFAEIVTGTDPAVDVIFTGHTHKEYAWTAPKPGGGTRPVIQTGSYGAKLGRVDLSYDTETDAVSVSTAALTTVGTAENLADPVVARVDAITSAAVAAADVVGDVAKGTVTDDVTTAFSGGSYVDGEYTQPDLTKRDDRASESTLGNLVADALRDTPITDTPGLPKPDLGIVNPGGLRAELFHRGDRATSTQNADGVVTFEEANAVLPFANNISYVTLTGAQLEQVLEQQWQTTATGSRPSRPFLHLGLSDNVRVVAKPDTSATSPVGDNVDAVWIDGAPLDPARQYVVSTFSFLASGGDNFRAFQQGTNRDTGKVDRDLWIDGYLANGQAKSPSYDRRQVFATGLPTTLTAGTSVSADLSRLNLTSLGSPANTSVTAFAVQGTSYRELGSFPVDASGAAAVDLTAPADLAGQWGLSLVAEPSRTIVGAPLPRLASRVKATVPKPRYGQRTTLSVQVDAPLTATGKVTVTSGGRTLRSARLKAGAAKVTLRARHLRPGARNLRVTYGGDELIAADRTKLRVDVRRASAQVAVRTAPKRVTARRTRAVVVTRVAASGASPAGRVVVRVAGRSYASKVRNGRAVVKLREFRRPGRYRVRVRYAGSDLVRPAATTATIKVTRRGARR
ncbi:bifunctional metallophosphatase/5'-nucleotidase [Nocardioides pantholopis]|uniref:bifunctional metallophosphatase/5'-nucleotidase n=1 Tax=Nocardioides pantholopis TaxID=2483798 RepID=UPI0013E29DC2|nr:bifunctional UDP-sugar hydrolase/5'-nucleotidase [Nocardioides pantholopis]